MPVLRSDARCSQVEWEEDDVQEGYQGAVRYEELYLLRCEQSCYLCGPLEFQRTVERRFC